MTTTIYQPLSGGARINGLPVIPRQVLDGLADELLRHPLDQTQEQVFGIIRHQYSWHTMLASLPNRAEEPRDNFLVNHVDAKWALQHDFDILGYIHTHQPREGNHGPSQADLDDLSQGYIGGVWMWNHHTVYWYGMGKVFHETSILRPLLLRADTGGSHQ